MQAKAEVINQTGILEEMLSQRQTVQRHLSQQHQALAQQMNNTLAKIERLKAENIKKKQTLVHYESTLSRQPTFELPSPLAQQLVEKLKSFENAHSYN